MQVFALFQSLSSLKTAISHLEESGIDSRNIFVVPMKNADLQVKNPDRLYPKNRDNVDKGFAFAAGISVITAGIGFKLSWGPIIWGIMGAIGGYFIGLIVSYVLSRKIGHQQKYKHDLPIILIVNCSEEIFKKIELTLFNIGAIGVNTPLQEKTDD